MRDPVKDLPRAIGLSCTLCTIIYVLTISKLRLERNVNHSFDQLLVAFHTVLSPVEVLGSEAVAVTFASRVYGNLSVFIPVFVAASCFGAVNGTLLTSSRSLMKPNQLLLRLMIFFRLFYAGAREGHMPKALSFIQTSKLTPAPSVAVITGLAAIYLTSSSIVALMNYVGFATWLSIGVAVACLPYLRWKQPDLERPIKVNLVGN